MVSWHMIPGLIVRYIFAHKEAFFLLCTCILVRQCSITIEFISSYNTSTHFIIYQTMTQKQFRRSFRFSLQILKFQVPSTFSTVINFWHISNQSSNFFNNEHTQSSHKSTVNIPDQPSFEIDGPAHNIRLRSYNMPGGMPTTSRNKLEISPSTMPTVDTTRKPAKPSDKPITGKMTKVQHILKIF